MAELILAILGWAGILLVVCVGVDTYRKMGKDQAKRDELSKTHDPETGYSYEHLAFSQPNKPSEQELEKRALEQYGPLPKTFAPMSAEYEAWLRDVIAEEDRKQEHERLTNQALQRAWLRTFQCQCGGCTVIHQWGTRPPIKWVGPCADTWWGKLPTYTTKDGYYNKRGKRLA